VLGKATVLSVYKAGEKADEGENVTVDAESISDVENISDFEHVDCS
jgi:hypothetical protein